MRERVGWRWPMLLVSHKPKTRWIKMKPVLNLLHISLVPSSNLCVLVMGSATLLAFLGLKAVFDFHAEKGIPHTYSLHSWLGSLYSSKQLWFWIFPITTLITSTNSILGLSRLRGFVSCRLGLIAVSLAVLQWVLGLVTFLFPGNLLFLSSFLGVFSSILIE